MQLEREIALLHRYIRSTFRVLIKNDFSPTGTKEGTRREDLIKVWNRAGYTKGVEIGVWRGSFSSYILENMPKVHLDCIDPWGVYDDSRFTRDGQAANYRRALQRLTRYVEEGRCNIHRKFSSDMHTSFRNEQLDFIFIDGGHMFDTIMMDLIQWVPKVRLGGMVAVHDYNPMYRGGVVEAVDAYTKCHLIQPWFSIREANATAFWVKQH